MAGKAYIKTGDYTWSRVKKIYLKTGGITWQAIRKAYLKTGTSTWKKIYDTASNKPFIGTDIPKIRLNTFRTNSSVSGTVNPVVEAPTVQQMGPPTTTPTVGWPNGTIGNHLWGYDGTWTSGNGSTIAFIYQWLYNLTGNSNDNIFDPQFYVSNTSSSRNTSSTGRADMLTNSDSYLGYDDGDYFDKNFLTFRVGASNSAGGPIFAESAPVYIVRKRPSGTIDLTNTNVDVPETLYANFTYQDYWYNKPDLYDSYIEWFAVDSASEALTASNRVEIQDLYTFTVTGTTTKSGTASYYATEPGKYYAARLTLNNSNTQSPVIPVSGFTPTSPFTAEDSTAPGSALEVTTLDILDYYGNAGTDNRDYIPVGGLIQIRSQVTGVDGSSTYRIRYRMYNWQNNSYYGMDGTNYGVNGGSSAWTTRTGSNTSFGFTTGLINEVTVSGNTATLNHREIVSSSSFGSTTYAIPGGSSDRWMIEIEVSVLKNSIRKYYADIVGGVNWYISRPAANLLFSASPTTAQVNSNITFSGSIGALGGGNSYPRQYKVVWGPGDETAWLPVGEYGYGTSNPSFTITKQFSTDGEYYPYFQTIPDYSNGNTSVVISPALSAPTPTGVIWNGTSFVISYTGGSGPWFQAWYRQDNTTYPTSGYDTGTESQSTSTITYTPGFTPTPGATYSFWVRSALESNSNTVSTVSSYSTTRVDVTIPQVATAPTSVTASNNGSSTTLTVSWSGSTNAAFYRIYWSINPTGPTNPGTSFDEEKAVNGSTITSSSGSWAWGPGDLDKNNNTPAFGGNYYFYVSASANGTTWTPYVRTSGITNLALFPPNINPPITVGVQGGPVSVSFSGGSGPFYQMFWWGTATAPTVAVTPDQTGSSSPLTDNTGPSSTATQYMYVRSVVTTGDTSAGASSTASAWSTGIPFNMTSNAVVQSTAPTAKATGTNSTTVVKYLDSITWSGGTYTNASSVTSTLRYSTQTSLLVSPSGDVDSNTSFRATSPYSIQTSDPAGTPYYFAVRDKVVGVNGTTYYFYSNQILSAKADGVAFSYGTATSATGGWTASISGTSQSGASYSYVSATVGSATVNSTSGAISATGLTSAASSTVRVNKSVSGYVDITADATGTASTVTTYTLTYNANSGSNTPTAQTGISGASITLASGAGTRTGFTFGGWSIGGSTYAASGSYTFGSADATATAIWTANFVTPTTTAPSWSSGSNFQRISGSSILRWYTDYPGISGSGSITGMQFQIRTTAGGGTLLADSTRSYPGAGSYPYSGGGTIWAFRCGTSDGDISYSPSARFARARVVMLGTNGTTYFGPYSGWI